MANDEDGSGVGNGFGVISAVFGCRCVCRRTLAIDSGSHGHGINEIHFFTHSDYILLSIVVIELQC